MTIIVNNKPVQCDTGASVAAILTLIGFNDQKGIAVAVNSTVISKSDWEKFELNENDSVMIIKATQGG